MAWEIEFEHIDHAEGHHLTVFVDRTVTDRHGEPVRHHLVIQLAAEACPHCGHVTPKNLDEVGNPRDHQQATIERLHEHSAKLHAYGRKHKVPAQTKQRKP